MRWMTKHYFRPHIGNNYGSTAQLGCRPLRCVAVSDNGRWCAFTESVDSRRSSTRCRFFEWSNEYKGQTRYEWVEIGASRGSRLLPP